ncbi:Cof-type HAD-IIB family hydrolase [Flavobacterium sp. N2038]|uniref:Cof-type HAD-IIB family hydrolase n=1 Tax=Flavobacterium sp. N2038 TaxID=2986829 RepID=UPI0022247275|nr:Cof-type HAD-IIB family hydrolase [Flavobacterium sp. N2038]
MLVLDMDDTLLTDDHKISDLNKKVLLEAQAKGIYVVLASGRPTSAMTAYAKELELDLNDSYMISFNGAIVSSVKDDVVLFEQKLTVEQIHDLYDYSIRKNTHIITYLDDEIISETDSEFIEIEKEITGMAHLKVASFKDTINRPTVKCILLEEPSYLKQLESDLKATMPHLSVSMSKPFFLEVAQNGIDKAASLRFLAQKLNILQEEIIAVGNAGNDLTMIEYAGLGVWVDNVTPELRDKADLIVASNNYDGVAEVVQKYLLN